MNIRYKWLWLFLGFTLMALLNIGVIVTDDLASGDKVAWTYYLINEFTGSWLVIPLVPVLLWFFKKYPIESKRLIAGIALYLLVTLLFGITHTGLMYLVRTPLYQLFGLENYGQWYGILGYRFAMEYFKQFIFFWVFYGAYLFFKSWEEQQLQQLRTAQLEEQLTKARLQSLQMQLNPHFLFNTLHAISGKMHEDPAAADNMMSTLSELLRLTLSTKEANHTLQQELSLLEKYATIMKVRFQNKIAIEMKADADVRQALVPVFLLQPLLENSIKHGMVSKEGLVVKLHASKRKNHLALIVEDNGPGIQGLSSNGIGWSNTLERLEQMYGEDHRFELTNKADGGLKVTVEIPMAIEENGLA